MSRRADKTLLQAVLEPRKQGALKRIEDACAAGADPNASCPECSTSTGFVPGGSTLLTHSVREGASLVVEKLLGGGADANLQDENGWTPWMASTLLDGRKRDRVQDMLKDHGAEPLGERVGQLFRAVFDGNLKTVSDLIDADRDSALFSSFRVDLVARQISVENLPMLTLLLENGVNCGPAHLSRAIRARFVPAVDLLLHHGVPAESAEPGETPLMVAAAMGELQIVQRLVDAGADVNRSAHDDPELTAAFHARAAGHAAVASWLSERMDPTLLDELERLREARDAKYHALYDCRTSGDGITTDEIVAALTAWDERYGVEVRDANRSSVSIVFRSAPQSVDVLYAELKRLCPDVSEGKAAVEATVATKQPLVLWWD